MRRPPWIADKMPWDQSLDEWLSSLPPWLRPLTAMNPIERQKNLTLRHWSGTDELKRLLIAGNWAQLKAKHENEMHVWLQSPRIRRLSPLGLHFELEGRRVLQDSEYENQFEQTTSWPQYAQVDESCEAAISRSNVVKIPKLKTSSPEEAEELRRFFTQLRHGNVHQTLEEYISLRERRADDQDFIRALGKTIYLQEKPDRSRLKVEYYVLLLWRHGFLWCIDAKDRPNAMFRGLFGLPKNEVKLEAIRGIRERLKLKSYEDFPYFYPQAPVKFILNPRDGTFQFNFPLPGQRFPLPKEE